MPHHVEDIHQHVGHGLEAGVGRHDAAARIVQPVRSAATTQGIRCRLLVLA